MAAWLVALTAGVAAAALLYWRVAAPAGPVRAGLAAIRAAAVALIVALIANAPLGRREPMPHSVFVDRSLSLTRGNARLAGAAWDSARMVGADSIWAFGDSVRPAREAGASDADSRIRSVVERSLATGAPAIIITDGELVDSAALTGLPGGSRLVVLRRASHMDAAVAALEAPRAAVAGDSIAVRVTVAAGEGGVPTGVLSVQLEARTLGRWPLDALAPWGERQIEVRVAAAGAQGPAVLRATIAVPGDAEPRNDTLAATIELSRAARAVFVSTSPDQDSRFALAMLRGALALPARGFLRVAPGAWRHEGSLTAASESDVREALAAAPLAILHGDTAMFGPPLSVTSGALALLSPGNAADGEWYASATPASPLRGALASIALDSLAPLSAGPPASGDWVALEVRRGREATSRAIVTGRDSPRRVVRITGSGFWRWRFRGGAAGDGYAALMGSAFDWLAAERGDLRAAIPDENVVRAGQPVRWRRGAAADSVVPVLLSGAGRTDTITLRFPDGAPVQESAPMAPGVYAVSMRGGRTLLAVSQSRELLPARPSVRSGPVRGQGGTSDARRARQVRWLYPLVIALLCSEWFLRRRAGLR